MLSRMMFLLKIVVEQSKFIDKKLAIIICGICCRLENLNSQFGSLIQKVSRLKRTGFLYKKNLESRCSDLQKAEAEVCP